MTKTEILLVTNKKGLSDSLISVSGNLEILWAGNQDQAINVYRREQNTIQTIVIDWDDNEIKAEETIML